MSFRRVRHAIRKRAPMVLVYVIFAVGFFYAQRFLLNSSRRHYSPSTSKDGSELSSMAGSLSPSEIERLKKQYKSMNK